MYKISLLALIVSGTLIAGNASKTPHVSENDRQGMLHDYLGTRVTNGRPVNAALVVLCSTVTGVPLDSAFAVARKASQLRDSIVVGNCNRIPYDIDSLSLKGARQVLRLDRFEMTDKSAVISAAVYSNSGMHAETATFHFSNVWILDSIVLRSFRDD